MRRRSVLTAGAAATVGLATWGLVSPSALAGPIGSGWTEVDAAYSLHQPPGKARHTLTDGEHHFWLYDTDPSTFPGQDSGPRSELRFHNEYTSGDAQFEADIKVKSGTYRTCVMQIFGGAGWATAFMTLAMSNSLNYYDYNQVIFSPVYDTYLHLNVVHETASGRVHVFVNRQFRATFVDHGNATHYFKCGLYGRAGMAARNDVYMKNIRLYRK